MSRKPKYKAYDINTENEYAKEQIAALMTQVLENIRSVGPPARTRQLYRFVGLIRYN